jgi:cephalosporin hydroxylase
MIQDAPEYKEFQWGVTVSHYGLHSSQNATAMLAISILLDAIKPRHIVEIGTGIGGLSVLIGIWAKLNGSNFRTYDSNDQRKYSELFLALGIDFQKKDALEAGVQEIVPHIQQPGVSLVLCDNGDKHRELAIYAPHLKLGDYIMMHDYAKSKEEYIEKIASKYWDWHESNESGAVGHGLTPVFTTLLEYAAWGCFRKEKE